MDDGLIVKRFLNNPIPSNCFIVHYNGAQNCLIVDPADNDPRELIKYLDNEKLIPDFIILTHEHFDHISGVNFLKGTYSCKVIATSECSYAIQFSKKNLSIFHDNIGFCCARANIEINQEHVLIQWGKGLLKFIKTPGHSKGSLCFQIDDYLFTGDTIIKDHKTVVKIIGGNKQQLITSLNEIFNTFDGNTLIFPGHGDSFRLKDTSIKSLI